MLAKNTRLFFIVRCSSLGKERFYLKILFLTKSNKVSSNKCTGKKQTSQIFDINCTIQCIIGIIVDSSGLWIGWYTCTCTSSKMILYAILLICDLQSHLKLSLNPIVSKLIYYVITIYSGYSPEIFLKSVVHTCIHWYVHVQCNFIIIIVKINLTYCTCTCTCKW